MVKLSLFWFRNPEMKQLKEEVESYERDFKYLETEFNKVFNAPQKEPL